MVVNNAMQRYHARGLGSGTNASAFVQRSSGPRRYIIFDWVGSHARKNDAGCLGNDFDFNHPLSYCRVLRIATRSPVSILFC